MPENAGPHAHPATTLALVLFTLISLGLGVVANAVASSKANFLRKYFLGNRSLGAFAVALTAAVMSGGTFLGFPSFVYQFGWVVGLWIASYMVAPLTILGVLGKRIGQLARRTGAITLPDLFRERFGSPALGLLTSVLVMFFLSAFLVAQFKAGAVIVKTVLPAAAAGPFATEATESAIDVEYLIGLAIFAATVVAYTAIGGFLAAIWTDVFQSLIMAAGVLLLWPLAMHAAGGLEHATSNGMELAGDGFAFGPGAGRSFHPIGLAFSFFVMWAVTGMGQPSTLVRLMAFRDSRTLRYSILYQCLYNAIIYIPLIFIFVAARSILPDLAKPDEVMPRLVIRLANPYIAGLILAAPYGAVMSTVSGFLLIVSSGLVRDIYQRFLRPSASQREVAWASYAATVAVGIAVTLVATRPPRFLQLIVIFASAGMASAFLMPAMLGAFWRRASAAGAIAAMAVGAGVTVGLYAIGTIGPRPLGLAWLVGTNPDIGARETFRPFYLLGLDPCVWGLSASLLAGVLVSLVTRPPDQERVAILFDAKPTRDPTAPE
ncbi:MAG TPA: sodium/solute symporter [Isosphaeraceae bacterium]|jgi:SSS family solute:Na+ symporter/sodium/pantothenate symporter|nr:sodium/solute symporter [Isosphaeraceae bacterium]